MRVEVEREGNKGKENEKLCCLNAGKVCWKWVNLIEKMVDNPIDVTEIKQNCVFD